MTEEKDEVETLDFVAETAPAEATTLTLREFLQIKPPGGSCAISDLWNWEASGSRNYPTLNKPQLLLHCADQDCDGLRYHRCTTEYTTLREKENSLFLDYICSNCRKTHKRFSLLVIIDAENANLRGKGKCEKYGEVPAFGPSTPPRLLRLFGSDKDLFLKGRRSETQGLGVGAYAYYRQIVENHKDSLFDEIIRVCNKINVSSEIIDMLSAAKKENRFTSALDKAKDAMPAVLLINGNNPLTLLHSALSEGLHAKGDSECLELANDIRIVLSELAARLGQALNDENEVKGAVDRLIARNASKPTKGA